MNECVTVGECLSPGQSSLASCTNGSGVQLEHRLRKGQVVLLVVESRARRAEVGYARVAAHARPREHDDVLVLVRGEECGYAPDLLRGRCLLRGSAFVQQKMAALARGQCGVCVRRFLKKWTRTAVGECMPPLPLFLRL